MSEPPKPHRYPGRLSFAPFKEAVRWGLGAFWTVMGVAVFALNEGPGQLRNVRSLGVASFALGAVCTGCLVALLSKQVRLKLLEPDRAQEYQPYPLILMGAVTGLLGAKFLTELIEKLSG